MSSALSLSTNALKALNETADAREKDLGRLTELALVAMASDGIPPDDKLLAQLIETLPTIIDSLVSR